MGEIIYALFWWQTRTAIRDKTGNVIETVSKSSQEDMRYHPTQKPLALMEYLINTYTNENDLILDFTCGSGSTLKAAKNLKRKCIGIEKEEKYCEISKHKPNK